MKLYGAVGTSSRVVRMFMLEKGINIEERDVDAMGGENRREPYLRLNPMGQVPCLVLDSGEVISESTVICQYLDEIFDDNPLMGETPEQRAETRMWCRRLDLNLIEPMIQGFRGAEAYDFFKNRMRVYPQASADFKLQVQEQFAFLDQQMAGKLFICGDRFSMADILLFCFCASGRASNQGIPSELTELNRWFNSMKARESVVASLHPSERAAMASAKKKQAAAAKESTTTH